MSIVNCNYISGDVFLNIKITFTGNTTDRCLLVEILFIQYNIYYRRTDYGSRIIEEHSRTAILLSRAIYHATAK